ncbi:hypothetical protein C5L31_002199 [Secundilactobacillus malefermentans]|uniref:Major facilitator superfamily (MFS) profile domain-containing protein n=2 Tax=Secundilactobacillus malefermentans TaxID=176292 RepID=A0A4R5NDC7_9LACO|nr:transport protein [Secundilactobacillus malefermentans DSM 5705 = KCTC 3548]TDG71412.1 hypothetical protein C5L31_002199 [Secundilactobacillus malefermentans]
MLTGFLFQKLENGVSQMTRANTIRLNIILYLNYFVHGVGLIILTQNMKVLQAGWHTSLATVAYVISALGIGRLLAYYILGSLSDKWGRKPFIYIGILSYAIFFAGILMTSSVPVAYGLTILAGVANSALDSGTYPTFMEMPGHQSASTVLIKAAMSAGEFVLPIMVSAIELNHFWYGSSFVFALAILAFNLAILPMTKFPKKQSSESAAVATKHLTKGQRIAAVGLLIYGYGSMALMIWFTQWGTYYAQSVLKLDNVAAHGMLSLYSIGSLTGVFLISIMLKVGISPFKLLVVFNAVAVAALVGICFAGSATIALMAAFTFGLSAAGGIMQVGLNALSELFPANKGRITGLFFTFGSIASVTVPLISGRLVTVNPALTLQSDLAVGVLCLIVSLVALRFGTVKETALSPAE